MYYCSNLDGSLPRRWVILSHLHWFQSHIWPALVQQTRQKRIYLKWKEHYSRPEAIRLKGPIRLAPAGCRFILKGSLFLWQKYSLHLHHAWTVVYIQNWYVPGTAVQLTFISNQISVKELTYFWLNNDVRYVC